MSLARHFSWFIVLVALLIGCLGMSWMLQASLDYSYAFWYPILDIGGHIDRYGPQNHYIQGLELLSAAEHVRLFAEISRAVHDHGDGLTTIAFEIQGKPQALLREPEVLHLQDVAKLIDVVRWLVQGAVVLGVGGLYWLLPGGRPQLRWQVRLMVFLAAGIALVCILVGPKKLFYLFHVWVFPPGHPWFFYYQDSLMSTLMKAPDLFAGIAVAILVPGVLLFVGVWYWIINRRAAARD